MKPLLAAEAVCAGGGWRAALGVDLTVYPHQSTVKRLLAGLRKPLVVVPEARLRHRAPGREAAVERGEMAGPVPRLSHRT